MAGENKSLKWKFWTQRRYIVTLLIAFGYFNIYSLRANLSVAIVAMTSDRYSKLENGTEINIGPEFEWENTIQGYVLSSFFYGYVTTQLIGGILGKKYGGKRIFGAGVATTALLTLISPWLADFSVYCLLAGRILMGIFEGVTYSSLYCIWSRWIPPLERTRVTSFANSGSYSGTVFSMMFYAYLAKVAGWRSVFWFSGSMGLVWFLIWLWVVSEGPELDPTISKEELQYIQVSLENLNHEQSPAVPWRHLLASKATWALNVTLFCETWGFYTLLTLLPKYFKDIFQFEISKSGILSALPYMCLAIMMPLSGQIADRIILKKWLSVTQTRKVCVALGFFGQTGFMLGAAFWENAAGTVFALAMAVGLGSFALSTISTNALDISPQHSSIVFGIANTWGSVPGVISPIIAGYIISTQNPTLEQWRIIFYITASLYFFGAIFFTVFGTGVRQSWDKEKENEETISVDKILNK